MSEVRNADPVPRVRDLPAATAGVVDINPAAPLRDAVTKMLVNDFSQLPVVNGHKFLGVISWKSIGARMALGSPHELVKDCKEDAEPIAPDAPLLSAVERVAADDYVVVQKRNQPISGIVTASDFSLQFKAMAEPFLLIGEIEQGIRAILAPKFSRKDLQQALSREEQEWRGKGVDDLTVGEYIVLLQRPGAWETLGLALDPDEFRSGLERVRSIRNRVMHFDPTGLDEREVGYLREFARFLRRLRDVGAV